MPVPPRRTLTVYGDESGDLTHFPHFLLGIVMTYAPDAHNRAIDALRAKHGYSRQFEYKKTDKLKVPLCRDVIDYFVAEPDLEFQAMRIRCAEHDLRRWDFEGDRSGRAPQVTAYNYRYRQIITYNTSARDDLVIMLDSRSRARGDNLPDYLKAQISNVKDVQLVDSARHNLIQLADLLVGSVFGELTNATHPIKLGLIQHLRGRLNVLRLSDDQSARLSRKFRVYKVRMAKT